MNNKQVKQVANAKGNQLTRQAYAYILKSIDSSEYKDEEYFNKCETDKDKIKFLNAVFNAEYGFFINRLGEQKAVEEWLRGLPSSINIDFNYSDILAIAIEWGAIPENYTESQADKIIKNWFNLIAAKTCQLFRKYS